ncbi:Asp23/Gls24 family envelope stress response protein [bacterium]|nr:Asp23/Gls24 family envelope stress response protein [bacterium]
MSAKDKPVHSPISKEESDSLSAGRIEIGEDVISAIAARAATKVQGIQVVGSSFRLSEFLGGKESSRRGVSVRVDEETGHVEIDLEVNIMYGTIVYESCHRLQIVIKDEVEALTGSLNVDKVNVRVRNVVSHADLEESKPVRPDQAIEAEIGGE